MAEKLNGILLVDKPAGWTSHDVVARLRRVTGEKRIGHAGTLDPMATGLLVVFIGRATRAVEFAEGDAKTYDAALRPGLVTDTQDTTGRVLAQSEARPTLRALTGMLPRFTGDLLQTPPMYSAIRQNGRRLYEIARAGGETERAPRPVTIFSLSCRGEREEDFLLHVVCSKGTYIRTLCHDIGQALGCGACLSALRRTEAGGFSIRDAHTLEEIEAAGAKTLLLPLDRLFMQYPACTVNAGAELKIRVGAPARADVPDGRCRVYAENGEFLMLGEAADGVVRTIKSFFEV